MAAKTLLNWGKSVSRRGGVLQVRVWVLCDPMMKQGNLWNV